MTIRRRYVQVGIDPRSLKELVGPVTVIEQSGAWMVLEYEEVGAKDGLIEAMDEAMAQRGYEPDNAAGEGLRVRSPNGTVWTLIVADDGTIKTSSV